ncbi:hypothetical protein VIGAN_11210100 [Vigna angularis var. angularis]|uniref:Disease resistance protein RPS4B/Roq1-like leucine-rich repeats domain-containing protein n=1 Tax=Vigna angularis var. angularis TaxID=157739 RepID=A0A0S3TBK4_PHAAN|nr:hypothetical protein VIGAN_11210100 [Vigna angularis var. angularis]
MENIRELNLEGCPIAELPLSFQNLTGLPSLEMFFSNSAIVKVPSSIIMMPKLADIYARGLKGLQWLKQEDGEEQMGPGVVPSKVEWLTASDCNLYDDFFSIDFTRFARLKNLWLPKNNFTILPECLKQCQFLSYLDVSDCKHLREIRGIPPNLKRFFAINCKSLASSSKRMLLNQELHEAGNTVFCLPGFSIPKWFNHQNRGTSISFWFRNKFPDKVQCVLVAPMQHHYFRPRVFINGKQYTFYDHYYLTGNHHKYLFDLRKTSFRKSLYEVPFDSEWNHAKVTFPEGKYTSINRAKIGIHIVKQANNMEDVRFTDPCSKRKSDLDISSSDSESIPVAKEHRFLDFDL